MAEHNHEEDEHQHEEHPGCKCGGVCKITGACGKHELKGEATVEKEKADEVEAKAEG